MGNGNVGTARHDLSFLGCMSLVIEDSSYNSGQVFVHFTISTMMIQRWFDTDNL